MTKARGRCKASCGNAALCYRWRAHTGETLAGPQGRIRAEGATAPVNSQANGPRGRERLWREMRWTASAEGITISGERTEGASLRRRCGAFTMPGCAMRRAPEDGVTWTGRTLRHLPLRALHEELGRQFRALRRVGDAGALRARRDGRTPVVPGEGGAVRCLAYGPGDAAPGRRRGAGGAGADGRDRPQGRAAALRVLHQ
jgi:hypothetical protein